MKKHGVELHIETFAFPDGRSPEDFVTVETLNYGLPGKVVITADNARLLAQELIICAEKTDEANGVRA